jgi:hypothetical protein
MESLLDNTVYMAGEYLGNAKKSEEDKARKEYEIVKEFVRHFINVDDYE